MEYGNYFKDAFQKLSLLEQDFDISVDAGKTDELATFIADDREAIPEEPVFDTAAENEDELQDNYVGKVIIECECCHSKFYKEPEDVIIDSETQLANIEDECPFCNATMGYTVIGKIEPFDEKEPTEDEVEIEVDDEVVEPEEPAEEETEESEEEETEEEVEESFNVGKFRRKLNEKCMAEKACSDDDCTVVNELLDIPDEEEPEDYPGPGRGYYTKHPELAKEEEPEDDLAGVLSLKHKKVADESLKESKKLVEQQVNPHLLATVIKNYLEEDVAMGYGWIELDYLVYDLEQAFDIDTTVEEVKTALEKTSYKPITLNSGEEVIIVNKSVKPEDIENGIDESCKSDESLTEGFNEVEIKTDDQKLAMTSDDSGKVTVTTEPLAEESITDEPLEGEEGKEEIAPLSDEDVSEIVAQSEEAEESEEENEETTTEDELEFEEPEAEEEGEEDEFDEFDEESFDQMGESYMRKVYDNIKSYKTTSVKESGDTLIVEGLITFTSGNTKKTTYTFSNPKMLKGDKVVLEGFNKTFSKTKKAFSLKGKIDNKKFITESLGYNYITKKLNESVRVTGRVKRILV